MFDLSQEALPREQLAKAVRSVPSSCCLLSQNLTVLVASISHLSMKNARFSSFSVSFSRFARRPPGPPRGLPQRRSFQAAYAIISAFTPIVNPPFFQPPNHYIFPSSSAKPPVYRGFWPFLPRFCQQFLFVKSFGYSRPFPRRTGRAGAAAAAVFPGAPLRRLGDEGEVRHQRIGLGDKVILSKGDEEDVLHRQQRADVGGAAAEAIVGGDGEKHIAAVAQVRFDPPWAAAVSQAPRANLASVLPVQGATSTRSSSFFGPMGSTSGNVCQISRPQISRRRERMAAALPKRVSRA